MLPVLNMLSTLNAELALAGESIELAGLKRSPPEMYPVIGDSDVGLKPAAERTYRGMQSIRSVVSSCSVSAVGVGGVGVRGGSGMGRLEAIGVTIAVGIS
jgi:hypothetical protein